MPITILFPKNNNLYQEIKRMFRVLICGAKGQLGSSLKELSVKFPEITFDFTDVEDLDILDTVSLNLYVRETNPDFIINCAAYTAVDKAEAAQRHPQPDGGG